MYHIYIYMFCYKCESQNNRVIWIHLRRVTCWYSLTVKNWTALYSTKTQAWTTAQHYDRPCSIASWRDHQVPRTLVGFKTQLWKAHRRAKQNLAKKAINLLRVVAHTKWRGDRDTLIMLYRAIVRSKLDYGCIVYGSASTSSLNKLNTIHNTGLRLALGAFCTSPVWNLYVEANEPPLKFQQYQDEPGNHDEAYSDDSKINEKVGAAAVIERLVQDGKTTRNLSRGLPDGSSIFSAEATAIVLALDYYNTMPAVRHDVVIYSDSLSCLQAIEGEDTEHPRMCRIMNLLWKLRDKGTHVKFCWIPSHCGIEGNEAADKLVKESLDLDIDALLGIYHADLKPQVNAYVQQLMQVKWDVEVHGRDLYLLEVKLAPPERYKHLKRAKEVAMTRLRIGHWKTTKGHIVSRGPPESVTTVATHHQDNTCYSNVSQSENSVASSTKQTLGLPSLSVFVP